LAQDEALLVSRLIIISLCRVVQLLAALPFSDVNSVAALRDLYRQSPSLDVAIQPR